MSNIECRYLSELDINDKFFDSLKEDYYNFNDWFKKKQDNNTLVALTVLIAESNPKEKEILVDLISNLIVRI